MNARLSMKPMRIAIFADNFTPLVNGLVTATCDLARGLAERGHRIWIFAPSYGKDVAHPDDIHPNITVVRLSSIQAPAYKIMRITTPNYWTVERILVENDIQLLHIQTIVTLGAIAVQLSRRLGIPITGTFHTLFADKQYLAHAHLDYSFMQRITWKYITTFYSLCDRTTAPSPYAKRELLAHGFKKKVEIISNGIDLALYRQTPARATAARAWRRKMGIKGPLVLYVGRVSREKSIEVVIDAFVHVHEANPKARLAIVGHGPQFEDVRAYAKKKLGSKVIFTGKMPHSEIVLYNIYGAADLFVTASTTETQGLTVPEAQASGVVCVGVSAGGTVDLVKHGKNGLLARPGDARALGQAMLRVLKDKDLRSRMQASTARSVQKHDLASAIDAWEVLYRQTIVRKPRR